MKKKLTTVILSGGVGSRLWPLSRKSRPKQYLQIFEGRSLFQLTLERNIPVSRDFIMVGNEDNHLLSKDVLEKSGTDYREIIEAVPRNTAAAIAFAALSVDPEQILLVTPSDHLIEGDEAYYKCIVRAVELAEGGSIVTFGIKPVKPETGYGYIESNGEQVISFREKPDMDTAAAFVSSGNFYWNSGMFCFKASVLLDELKSFEPEIYTAAKKAWRNAEQGRLNAEEMLEIPSKSIDYAVMERSKKIKMVAGDFEWSDLGSFESLYDYFRLHEHKVDAAGNMLIGSDKHFEFLGIKDSIVVDTQDALLVLRKENAQEVKNIYERLEKDNSYLIK